MKIINLVHKEKSEIDYHISQFPDGETKITIGNIDHKEQYKVLCRIRNANELFTLMQIADILNRHDVVWDLKIFYLMSMRMDRVMTFNDPYNLKIVTNIINNLGASNVEVYHPHSEKTNYLLNIKNKLDTHINYLEFCSSDWQICYPDKGAAERYSDLYVSNNIPLICEKKRDIETGKIIKIEIINKEIYNHKPIMVVDDLCDAGGTFIGVANAIRELNKDSYIGISVIHMVNSKGIENLCNVYDEVSFTNSYNDWTNLQHKCKMYDVIN